MTIFRFIRALVFFIAAGYLLSLLLVAVFAILFIEDTTEDPVTVSSLPLEQINEDICWWNITFPLNFRDRLENSDQLQLQNEALIYQQRALNYREKGDLEEATFNYQKQLKIYKQLFGKDADVTLKVCKQLVANARDARIQLQDD